MTATVEALTNEDIDERAPAQSVPDEPWESQALRLSRESVERFEAKKAAEAERSVPDEDVRAMLEQALMHVPPTQRAAMIPRLEAHVVDFLAEREAAAYSAGYRHGSGGKELP